MSFVQNFPFFSIILCLLCAVTTFVAGDKWGRRLTIGLVCDCRSVLYLADGFGGLCEAA